MKKALLKTIYNSSAFAPFHWANRKKVLILTYHRFGREKDEAKISAAQFESHLQYLKDHNTVLPLAETIDHLKKGKSLPLNPTVITIDDGYADAFDIAFPLLKKFDFPATVYAVTDFLDGKIWLWTDLMRYVLLNTQNDSIDVHFGSTSAINADLSGKSNRLELADRINTRLKKLHGDQKDAKIREISDTLQVRIPERPPAEFAPLNWTQTREMDAENIRIESHSVTHPILTKVGQADLDFEIQNSKKRLEEVLDRQVEHFCYPNGTLDNNVQKATENAGYKSAVTTSYGFNDARTNQFLMNRIDAQPSIENFAQSVSGFELLRQKIF